MIGVILFIVALALVMGVAPYVLDEKGYVLISFNHTTIEGTIIGFCGSIIIAAAIGYLLYKLLGYIWSIYSKTKHRFFARGQERKQLTLEQALYCAINDDYQALEHVLVNNSVAKEFQDIRLALLAKSALAQQDTHKALTYLLEISPAQQLKVAKLWLASGDSRAIVSQLAQLASSKKATGIELKLYAEVLVQQQQWQELETVLPRLVRKDVLTQNQWDAIFARYFASFSEQQKTAKYQALSKKLHAVAENAYLQEMITAGLIADVESALLKMLKQNQHQQLAALLSGITRGEAKKLYLAIQEKLKQDDSNNALLLALACLANAQGDYELAARVFDKALSAENKALYIKQATLSYNNSAQADKALVLYSS